MGAKRRREGEAELRPKFRANHGGRRAPDAPIRTRRWGVEWGPAVCTHSATRADSVVAVTSQVRCGVPRGALLLRHEDVPRRAAPYRTQPIRLLPRQIPMGIPSLFLGIPCIFPERLTLGSANSLHLIQ